MQRKDIVVFFAALYYGIGIHSLTDTSILVSHSLRSTQGLFESCQYLGNTAAASFLIAGTYPQWKSLFVGTGEGHGNYDWHLSLGNILTLGFAYGNAIVYPTEFVCWFYDSSTHYVLDRLLLAAPCALLLACFAEMCGWNARMRHWMLD